ncbi:hypothetical protein [Ligilactobacillus ruminis]|uniref:hypothetical protein n=1 Tax=Ligilactobacillus ruminis TaxID=1623 RepID=UPI0012AFD246|nr:hypothetical protein [Ligilactobacillus ruminis]
MKTDFLSNAELRIACSINASKLAYGQRFLRFARNLRQHCFDESNRVEHFSNFWGFCSTFGSARVRFGGGGRTFSQFFGFLFYFRGRADRIWWRR